MPKEWSNDEPEEMCPRGPFRPLQLPAVCKCVRMSTPSGKVITAERDYILILPPLSYLFKILPPRHRISTTTRTMEPFRNAESDIKQTESLLPGAATFPRPSGRAPFRRKPISERHERLVYRTRLTLRILTFVLSLALVVVLGHAVSVYYSSKDDTMFDNSLRMDVRIWPLHMKMKPTLFLLGSASVATLLSGIICVGSFSKAVSLLNPHQTCSRFLTISFPLC